MHSDWSLVLIFSFICIHCCLYLLWRIPAYLENRARKNINWESIPFYWTGDIADIPVFTLVSIAFALAIQHLSLISLPISILGALMVMGGLHWYWVRLAKQVTHPQQVYLPNGSTTIAGKLHLLYVWYASFITIALLLNIAAVPESAIIFLVSGYLLYGLAVILDYKRGII